MAKQIKTNSVTIIEHDIENTVHAV